MSTTVEKFHAEHWHNYAQPKWNTETSVADALSSVWATHDSDSSKRACNKLLYAVGTNHARTYYPVLVGVTPFMDEIFRSGWFAGTRASGTMYENSPP